MNDKVSKFINSFGITKEGFEILAANASEEQILSDISLLEEYSSYFDVSNLDCIGKFNTNLWTLLGEIATPHNLGLNMPDMWPLLVFPSGMGYKQTIYEGIRTLGGIIISQKKLKIGLDLHADLYAGQAWYPSLRQAFAKSLEEYSTQGLLIWLKAQYNERNTLAAIARKMQQQVRPLLPEFRTEIPGMLFPGIQRAFHTPRLDNVLIHCLIFKKYA